MPARLLAYGGTSFSERRRIGQWPAVPEATLRDTYGLTATSWCYGAGTLGRQPFVILRQRQNIENRGGYPFSLLLDPGEAVWQRFGNELRERAGKVRVFCAPEIAEVLEATIKRQDFLTAFNQNARLHLKRHFVLRNARCYFGIIDKCVMLFVQRINGGDVAALAVAATIVRCIFRKKRSSTYA